MIELLKRMVHAWSHWIGDKDLEDSLRRHLDGLGYYGDSARFADVRLAAIQRPGWLQVFVFSVSVKQRSVDIQQRPQTQLFGIARQDERYNKLDVRTFLAAEERNATLDQWSEGLLRTRRSH